jgi:hypothetical protein
MKRRVMVGRDLIDEGVRRDPRRNPVAAAIRRSFGRPVGVAIVAGRAFLHDPRAGHMGHPLLPMRVLAWLDAFDRHGARGVRPIIFTMEV